MITLINGHSVLKTSELLVATNKLADDVYRTRLTFKDSEYFVHREHCTNFVFSEDFIYKGNDLNTANIVFEKHRLGALKE